MSTMAPTNTDSSKTTFTSSPSYGRLPLLPRQPICILSYESVARLDDSRAVSPSTFAAHETNPSFVLTYHPALRVTSSVMLERYEPSSERFWVMFQRDPQGYLEAGGFPIQVHPSVELLRSEYGIWGINDPADDALDPYGFLRGGEVEKLVGLFPRAVGFRLLRAGLVTVLFRRRGEIDELDARRLPCTFGGLNLGFDSLEECRYEVTGLGEGLGVTVEMEDGRRGGLVATHSVVKGGRSWIDVVVGAIGSITKLFSRFTGSPVVDGSNSTETPLGTVLKTFDRNAPYLTFPTDFTSDLTLIDRIQPPSPSPPATTFASLDTLTSFHPPLYTQHLLPGPTRTAEALLAGSEYYLDQASGQFSIALLWRTSGVPDEGATHGAGSALCLGSPEAEKDGKMEIVCFESAKVHLRMRYNEKGMGTSFRMGFLLPEAVRKLRIV